MPTRPADIPFPKYIALLIYVAPVVGFAAVAFGVFEIVTIDARGIIFVVMGIALIALGAGWWRLARFKKRSSSDGGQDAR